jgi:CTD nuclear envelope phosphatase 1
MKKKTLVLDLDETLVHSTTKSSPNCDFKIEVSQHNTLVIYYVFIRPKLKDFLNMISQWYKISIYTASVPEYADQVLDIIDTKRIIRRRLFRDHCVVTTKGFTKDLTQIESDLSQVILIDNSDVCFQLFPNNGIAISTFTTDKSDNCLMELIPLLDALRFVNDVRSLLKLRRNKYNLLTSRTNNKYCIL